MADTYVIDMEAFGEEVITTTVTSSGEAVEAWLEHVRSVYRRCPHEVLVGLDFEWRPSYSPVHNPVVLLQLCVHRECLIFQILHPNALAGFLAKPQFRFVGVGMDADFDCLSNDYGLQVANTEDLRGVVAEGMGMPDLWQAGLNAVARAVLGASLQKPHRVRTSPWDAYCLSDEEIHYACIDASPSRSAGSCTPETTSGGLIEVMPCRVSQTCIC